MQFYYVWRPNLVVYRHPHPSHAEEASLELDAETDQVMLTLRTVDGFDFSDGK
ncbi:MAG: hypothetical protein GY904_17905, partial [Planctomycetaceae bacterium]|nr:hypothetical protein [Planctomycetaceae bacterium]